MEWENILAATTESAISETEFSSDGTNADADDEQSDWREFNDLQLNSQTHGHLKDLKALITDGNLSDDIIRRIECFALDSDEKELILTQVYHSTQV